MSKENRVVVTDRDHKKMNDRVYMRHALDLAAKGYGSVSPNPYVGAVIVKDERIIGEGYHPFAGASHAEVVAIESAMESLEGATIYVTLEPCCHVGRTGACTDRIIESGITRVVTAMEDPNPVVSGKGHQILHEHGIEVKTDCCKDEAQSLNRYFITNQREKRPFVTLKAAMSLDGKLATQSRDSQWITGVKARKYTHHLRGLHDAILIGKGTLMDDDPMLNVRYGYDPFMPKRVLLLNNFEGVTADYQLFDLSIAETIILYDMNNPAPESLHQQLIDRGVRLISLPDTSPKNVINQLYKESVYSLMLEGGAKIYSSFINANLVDQYSLFYGPRLIGNPNALELWGSSNITTLTDAPILTINQMIPLEESFYVEAYPTDLMEKN